MHEEQKLLEIARYDPNQGCIRTYLYLPTAYVKGNQKEVF